MSTMLSTQVLTPITPVASPARPTLASVPSVTPLKRKRSKRGEGDRLREEILDAVDAILASNPSPEAISIRAVAERVGCTPPAIYLHFFDKQELLFDVCARQFTKLDKAIDAAAESADENPLNKLAAGMRAYIQFGLDHPEHYRILFMGHQMLTPEQLDELRRSGVTGIDRLIDRCRQCIKAEIVRDDDPRLMAYGAWAVAHGLVSLQIAKPHVEWPAQNRLVDHMVDTYVRGIAK